MNIGKLIFYCAFALCAVIVLVSYMKSEKPARSAFGGMLSGAAALLLAHFLGIKAGLYLPLNFFTTVISLILGAPAVIIMALMEKFIF